MVMHRTATLVGWLLGLTAAVAILLLAGHGPLAAPPLEPGAWPAWSRAREPVDAAVALARTASLFVAAHLLLMTVLALPCAYVLARFRLPGVKVVITVLLIMRMIPVIALYEAWKLPAPLRAARAAA